MINKNNEEFFSNLEKKLPSSGYTERFTEELSQHMEDEVETAMEKGADKDSAQKQAIRKIGNADTLTHSYIKRLRPDLLLSAYFESLVVGSMAAIFCLGYFLLSLTRQEASDPDSWETWGLYIIFPFFFFLIFYLLSFTSTLKKSSKYLRFRLISIVTALPFITILGIAVFGQGTQVGNFYTSAIIALIVNYAAFGFAIYIIIRGLKTAPPLLASVVRYINYSIVIAAELYLILSSVIPHLYPQTNWLYSFLYLRKLIDEFFKVTSGISFHMTTGIMNEIWIFGILFTIIAIFCLASLALYVYSKKYRSRNKFPKFRLVLFTYILLLFVIPPVHNFYLPINWLRPAANAVEVIEKKQSGPFYYWFLNLLKNKNAYFPSGLDVVDDLFIERLGLNYTSHYNLNKDAFIIFMHGQFFLNIITNIKSTNEFNLRTETFDENVVSLEMLAARIHATMPPPTLAPGFKCTPPKIITSSPFGNNNPVICTALAYNSTSLFSGNKLYEIFSVRVDSEKKWALIHIGDIQSDWPDQTSIYLVSLP